MSKKRSRILEYVIKYIGGFLILLLIVFSIADKTKFYFLIGAIIIVSAALLFFIIRSKKNKVKKINKRPLDRDLLNRLRAMHPNEFEEYIADLYRRLGYKTERVGGSYDGGIDVTATKDGIKHYIQCKKFITSKASVHDVRDFAGALMDKLSQGKGIFITTNIFSTEAEQYAKDKPIELIDREKLLRLIKSANIKN